MDKGAQLEGAVIKAHLSIDFLNRFTIAMKTFRGQKPESKIYPLMGEWGGGGGGGGNFTLVVLLTP